MRDADVLEVVASNGFEQMRQLAEDHAHCLRAVALADLNYRENPNFENDIWCVCMRSRLKRAENALKRMTTRAIL
jgi:hypothetical protein